VAWCGRVPGSRARAGAWARVPTAGAALCCGCAGAGRPAAVRLGGAPEVRPRAPCCCCCCWQAPVLLADVMPGPTNPSSHPPAGPPPAPRSAPRVTPLLAHSLLPLKGLLPPPPPCSAVKAYRLEGSSITGVGELTDDGGVRAVQSLSFDRGLNRAVAGCSDRLLRVWDLERCAGEQRPPGSRARRPGGLQRRAARVVFVPGRAHQPGAG
jgi:hypothetical protein